MRVNMFYILVCVKFIGRFMDSLNSDVKSVPNKIEDEFRKFCKNTKKDDNRFVSRLSGSKAIIISGLNDCNYSLHVCRHCLTSIWGSSD